MPGTVAPRTAWEHEDCASRARSIIEHGTSESGNVQITECDILGAPKWVKPEQLSGDLYLVLPMIIFNLALCVVAGQAEISHWREQRLREINGLQWLVGLGRMWQNCGSNFCFLAQFPLYGGISPSQISSLLSNPCQAMVAPADPWGLALLQLLPSPGEPEVVHCLSALGPSIDWLGEGCQQLVGGGSDQLVQQDCFHPLEEVGEEGKPQRQKIVQSGTATCCESIALIRDSHTQSWPLCKLNMRSRSWWEGGSEVQWVPSEYRTVQIRELPPIMSREEGRGDAMPRPDRLAEAVSGVMLKGLTESVNDDFLVSHPTAPIN